MLGREMVKKSKAAEARLSEETLAIMKAAKVHNPIFGGGNKELWNEAARKFNAAAYAEIGEDAKACELAIFK